jgi:hypothetical protein
MFGIEMLVLAANTDPIVNAKLDIRIKILPSRDFIPKT